MRPRLQGFRLIGGRYVPLLLADDRLYSEQLNLYLVIENNTMRFFNPETGEVLRTLVEETQAHLVDARRAERETERAESEAARADSEAQRASAAEAEVERLMAELHALKQKNEQQ